MSDPVEQLVLDLLEWLERQSRPYSEVIEAWRTSCPRLPVWEEANARGFVERRHEAGDEARVLLSWSGKAFLGAHRVAALATSSDGIWRSPAPPRSSAVPQHLSRTPDRP